MAILHSHQSIQKREVTGYFLLRLVEGLLVELASASAAVFLFLRPVVSMVTDEGAGSEDEAPPTESW